MEKISKLIKVLGYLDYALSAGALAYGIYAQSWLYGAAGVVGLIIAYLKPAERLKGRLQRKFSRQLTDEVVVQVTSMEPGLTVLPTTPTTNSGYRPRRRYSGVKYFASYEVDMPAPRLPVTNATDYGALLAVPERRFRPGIKPTKIVPR